MAKKNDFLIIKIPLKHWKKLLISVVIIILVLKSNPETVKEIIELFK